MTENDKDQSSSVGAPVEGTELEVRLAVRSDVGRVRSENQDFAIISDDGDADPLHGQLMVVADGMGGHKGGATASKLAATTIKEIYLASDGEDIAGSLKEAIEKANARIHEEADANEDLEGMGTTTSAMVIRNGQAWIGHVGDSRIYRVRAGEIEQMTEDHSLVATMVKEGLLTAEEAETHPRRNVLQRSMGVAAEVDVDISGPFDLVPGDRFILCSDGLHGLLTKEEIGQIAAGSDIESAADEFIDLALERGAHDNVTVIVAAVEGSGEAEEPVPSPPPPSEVGEDTLPQAKVSSGEPSMGAGGCLLRTLLLGLALIAIAGSFLLLVAGEVFVGWFASP